MLGLVSAFGFLDRCFMIPAAAHCGLDDLLRCQRCSGRRLVELVGSETAPCGELVNLGGLTIGTRGHCSPPLRSRVSARVNESVCLNLYNVLHAVCSACLSSHRRMATF